jgi:hypothetical protein
MLRQVAQVFADEEITLEEGLRWSLAAIAPIMIWDEEYWYTLQVRQLQSVREAGLLAHLPIYVNSLGILATWRGDFATAASLIAEFGAIAEATGTRFSPYADQLPSPARARAARRRRRRADGVTRRREPGGRICVVHALHAAGRAAPALGRRRTAAGLGTGTRESLTRPGPRQGDTSSMSCAAAQSLSVGPAGSARIDRDVQQIVTEQAALRRVATLVARGVCHEELFAVVSQELARLAGADAAALLQFEPDETITLRAAVRSLLRHIALPVGAEVMPDRLPAYVETTAYFVVAEALTSVVKHARAIGATVHAAVRTERWNSRSATTARAAPTPGAAPGSPASPIASRASTAPSPSPAHQEQERPSQSRPRARLRLRRVEPLLNSEHERGGPPPEGQTDGKETPS